MFRDERALAAVGVCLVMAAMAGGAAGMTQLDIADGGVVVDYGDADPTPMPQILGWINGGRNGGSWDGQGIVSSVAHDDGVANGFEVTVVGYADNGLMLNPYDPEFLGAPVDMTSVIMRYTVNGDADLDGLCSDSDVDILGLYYDAGATTGHFWYEGDFDFDGMVSDSDVDILGLMYGSGVADWTGGSGSPEAITPPDPVSFLVPEPLTATLGLGLGGLGLYLRRRRAA